MEMHKILNNSKGKLYKQLARCQLCGKMYVVDTDGNNSRYYCKVCYKRSIPRKE